MAFEMLKLKLLIFGLKSSPSLRILYSIEFRLVLCEILVSSYSIDVKSEEILKKSQTMVLAIDRILDDFISKQSNSLFICHQETLQSSDSLRPTELLNELLQFVSNDTKMAFEITAAEYERPMFLNNLFIVDSYESFA